MTIRFTNARLIDPETGADTLGELADSSGVDYRQFGTRR